MNWAANGVLEMYWGVLGYTTDNEGSDPLIQTARGKLQSRRSKLNDQINKELRMRSGAENLYRATDNKKLREQVAVELSFFNSNIQLLKEELCGLNSSVEIYQHDNCSRCVPMIPLGLKETKDVEFRVPFMDVILEHYSEDGRLFDKEIQELLDLRQAIRTPLRDWSGVELLTEYFNQLYYVERRFFPEEGNLAIHFHWYDSLTGVPNTQKAIGFEKGSVLFNIAALCTQIACKQDRMSTAGSEEAIRSFEKAAGYFRHLETHFKHAPSMDMRPETLTMLVELLQAQAQECVFESKTVHGLMDGVLSLVKVAQEAAYVSERFRVTHRLMSAEPVKSYLPFTWTAMAQTKHYYYKGLAHSIVATALMDQKDSGDLDKLKQMMEKLHVGADIRDENNGLKIPTNDNDRKILGKAHLRESVLSHEEALRVHDLCKQLRKIDTFRDLLQKAHERTLEKFEGLEEEDDFSELLTVPRIEGKAERETNPMPPEFSKVKVLDIFATLGPITIFNSRNEWSAARRVQLDRSEDEGFGFSVRGDSPVMVAEIEPDSVAGRSSMKVGDFVVGVGTMDTKWAKHEQVVQLVRQAGSSLELRLITPMGQSFLERLNADRPYSTVSLPASPVRMQSPKSSVSSEKSNKSRLSAPWIFMRRNSSKEKSEKRKSSDEFDDDIVSR
ncbi:rhophilin-2-B-like isoform X2 [Haliotis rufescens]|uniref:rhophilin-2-B-like isoform X2 n=1 Tax=Haliotis rufescens TaxID=6454 RepID=UPI001EB04229|nr:rhophilin-2-B-like isoform X2 [Haliotis rufescens]